MKLVIGTRGSRLALLQAQEIKDRLAEKGYDAKLEKIKTTGDRIINKTLSKIGGKGLFVKEIEVALLKRQIDLAVHSMKDVPASIPEGLKIGAISKRLDPRDVLVTKRDLKLDSLPKGAVLGTSSLRRAVQIKRYRPDIKIVPIRGNIDTRIKKMHTQGLDGIILAYAGLKRLGMEHIISQIIPEKICIPAVGQGALGVETRQELELQDICALVNDADTKTCINAERVFLKALNGGCHIPIGAIAKCNGEIIEIKGFIADPEGKKFVIKQIQGPKSEALNLGENLGKEILYSGGAEILKEMGVYPSGDDLDEKR